MDNAKIIERVRKLMAMAQDSSSPNEAAIAATRARKLMDEHSIDFRALEEGDGFTTKGVGGEVRFMQYWKQALAIGIADLNDCIVDYEVVFVSGKVTPHKRFRFKGVDSDVEAAILMYQSIHDAILDMCKTWMSIHNPGHYNARLGTRFKDGAATEIKQRCAQIAKERHTAGAQNKEVLVIKKQLVEQKFGVANYGKVAQKTAKGDRAAAQAFSDGYHQAKTLNIRDEVSGS